MVGITFSVLLVIAAFRMEGGIFRTPSGELSTVPRWNAQFICAKKAISKVKQRRIAGRILPLYRKQRFKAVIIYSFLSFSSYFE